MPLWRIPISGITVGTPVKLYGEVLSPLDGIYSKTWAASQIPNLPASKITSGTFDVARIPGLPASKITSEVFQPWQLPDLDAGKIVSGTFAVGRIPNIDAGKVTSGTFSQARIPQQVTVSSVNATIPAASSGDSSVSVTAPSVSGYTFLFWLAAVPQNATCEVHAETPTSATTRFWTNGLTRYTTSAFTIKCYALYRRTS